MGTIQMGVTTGGPFDTFDPIVRVINYPFIFKNPLWVMEVYKFYEVQKYAYETEHVRQWIYSVVGVKQFNALSPELKNIVKESAQEAQNYAQNEFVAYQKKVKDDLISKGMIIRKMDQESMKNKIVPKLEEILTAEQFDLYKRIQEIK